MKVLFYRSNSDRNLILEYINKQSQFDIDNCLETISLLEMYGFSLPPKLIKKIKGAKKLWELRISATIQHRFLFSKTNSEKIIILHAFNKKTQKTPMREINTAISRLNNYKSTL